MRAKGSISTETLEDPMAKEQRGLPGKSSRGAFWRPFPVHKAGSNRKQSMGACFKRMDEKRSQQGLDEEILHSGDHTRHLLLRCGDSTVGQQIHPDRDVLDRLRCLLVIQD